MNEHQVIEIESRCENKDGAMTILRFSKTAMSCCHIGCLKGNSFGRLFVKSFSFSEEKNRKFSHDHKPSREEIDLNCLNCASRRA